MTNPFHEGERQMQDIAGEREVAELNAPMISPKIAKGAIPFLTSQSLAVLGLEYQKELRCTCLIGESGFIAVPDQFRLTFDLSKVYPGNDSAIAEAAGSIQPAGSLFIDLATRRRFRINGELSRTSPEMLQLRVREAFGNCPKYVTRRTVEWNAQNDESTPKRSGESFSAAEEQTLRRADLLFVATSHPDRGPDASHRGGNPGFVTVADDKTLLFPDYPGNSLFNSLGNLLVDNRIGLLVPDLARSIALRITGTAKIDLRNSRQEVSTSDSPRMIAMSVSRWEETAFPIRSAQLIDYSPFNP